MDKPLKDWTLGISIHAPRVGSDANPGSFGVSAYISIHAPRVGSDVSKVAARYTKANISIHAPRVGSDGSLLEER